MLHSILNIYLINIYVISQLSNCDLPVPADSPLLMAWSGKSLCYACRDSYNQVFMEWHKDTKVRRGRVFGLVYFYFASSRYLKP